MSSIPDRHEFTTRLPPHVYRELEGLFGSYKRHFKGQISNSDMVGALIMRARRDRFGLMEDLAAFLDVQDSFKKGVEILPER